MASPAGRILRIVAGVVLIVLGLGLTGPAGWVLATIGLVPIAAGAGNVCLLAPLLGAPFKGSDAKR
jgi:sulfite exporter TauE/SafE